MYADDLVVIAETEDGLINGLNEWKDNMENKGVRGNKVSWYPVLSKFISYIPEDCRLCRFAVPKLINIDTCFLKLFENVTRVRFFNHCIESPFSNSLTLI